MNEKKTSLGREYIKGATFGIMGMLGISIYILADTFFIATGIGNEALASLNIAIPVYGLLTGMGLMLGIGGATKFTILRARGEHRASKRIFTNTLILGGGFSLIMTLGGLFYAEEFTRFLGADESIFQMTKTYLRTVLLFSSFFIMNNIFVAFVRNDNNPRIAMLGMVIGSFGNIVLDYIFIFPLQLGMLGAALATVTAPAVGLSLMIHYWLKHSRNLKLKMPTTFFKEWLDIIRLGSAAFITDFSNGLVILLFNLTILGIAGNIGVAAYGVVANMALVIVAVYIGIGQGIQPLISESFGKKREEDLKRILRWTILLTLGMGALTYTGGVIFAPSIMDVFNSEGDPTMSRLGIEGIRVYFSAFLLMGINITMGAFFAAVSLSKPSIRISLLRGVFLIIPLVFILPRWMEMLGVWLVVPIVELITVFVVIGYLRYYSKKVLQQS
ncbi:MATE family efflux transporter [Isachenkonia alkalipeptolytica]|uniref:Multidrug export protein MepA n=1 Tax=Isachenkonia alkalipeptolytica TaxID=2565777 RepID=A0AA43XLP6_9CLOT|nr:MATE family efflux transporter [Isachenkonia alkalipeptolytica]NBG88611.1 MATE family efflux transporter [Isachenkonia alkalipeptolytica]